jgi:PIN domain nuclease of toxin-antitoxin system
MNPIGRVHEMKVLFDTHLLLWAAAATDRLPKAAVDLMQDPETEPVFSMVSLWEIVIKASLGRSDFRVNAGTLRDGLLGHGWSELNVRADHVLAMSALPDAHRDPFDRLLVSQAIREQIKLITADTALSSYGSAVRVV